MEIQNSHIKEAEAILIDGNTFDEKERVPFIKNLETRDLLAVPGSGKTTALQAKLYCIAKQMPFDNRSGVLVLSHTNKAVEEIEKKLKEHCPQLFQHPNFIGTVQSFVNSFLASPGCCQKYQTYLSIVDDIIANRNIDTEIAKLQNARTFHAFLFFQCYSQAATITRDKLVSELNFTEQEASAFIKTLRKERVTSNGSLVYNKVYTKENRTSLNLSEKFTNTLSSIHNEACKKANEDKYKIGRQYFLDFKGLRFTHNKQTLSFSSESGKHLLNVFELLFIKGIVRYRDCYSIALQYIDEYGLIADILRSRFKYIFIDEAQDLEKYQLDIIESIFNTEESNCVIQRIGDINQSIYNSGKSIKIECDWEPRNPMSLNSSKRLTKEIADIVDYFTLKKDFPLEEGGTLKFEVKGGAKIEELIQPYLILFDDDSIGQLKTTFEELINKHNLFDGLDGINTKKGYKVIGWSGTWKEEDSKGRLRLENIFPNEYIVASESKKSKDNLSEYLIYKPKVNTLKQYSDDIIEALCIVLRIAECLNTTTRKGQEIKRYYTSQTLWKYLNQESKTKEGKISEQDLLDLKSKLYSWSFSIATNSQIEATYNEIKSFVTDKLSIWCEFSITPKVSVFLGEAFNNTIITDTSTESNEKPEVPIEICSIHSVKGQTHCATMYVETFKNGYETEKINVTLKKGRKTLPDEYLPNPLLAAHHNFRDDKDTYAKESIKMMYVGFSRPTHLLCYAIHKSNFTERYRRFFEDSNNGWKLMNLTTKI